MKFTRMPIEVESPEERGYGTIRYNLAESSVTDRPLGDLGLQLDTLVLAYADHRGLPELRAEIAQDTGVTPADILTTAGAAGALFIIATTLLEPTDHLIVLRPNYATNIETPRAIGCAIDFVDLAFEDGFALDVQRIRALMTPQTRLISLTNPHNPTGICLPEGTLQAAAALADEYGCRLLVDETYRDMTFGPKPPLAATLGPNVISVSSMSKAFGIPGIRVGWIVNRDPLLMRDFLAAKEQIGICGSIVDESIAAAAIAQRGSFLTQLAGKLLHARNIVEAWIKGQDDFEWVKPEGGCVCFPRLKPALKVDIDRFYQSLDADFGTMVGPGHWFEMNRRFMRVGFGWPTHEELAAGLTGLSGAVEMARLG